MYIKRGKFIVDEDAFYSIHLSGGKRSPPYHTVKFRMVGPYNIWADYALLSLKTGVVHAITCREHSMAQCGRGAQSYPMESVTVLNEMLTCKRCIANMLSKFLREGALKSLCART